jgi:microcystin degradation protein MlrC
MKGSIRGQIAGATDVRFIVSIGVSVCVAFDLESSLNRMSANCPEKTAYWEFPRDCLSQRNVQRVRLSVAVAL